MFIEPDDLKLFGSSFRSAICLAPKGAKTVLGGLGNYKISLLQSEELPHCSYIKNPCNRRNLRTSPLQLVPRS